MSTVAPSSDLSAALKTMLANRRSCRAFTDETVPKETIDSILADAQMTCSNANTQPWHVAVVSGEKLKELKAAYVKEFTTNGFITTGDFEFDLNNYKGVHSERQKDQGKGYFQSIGVARDDTAARAQLMIDNFHMYNAQHTALFFMPDAGEGNVRQAGDIGQYGMTLMLSCTAHGLESLPQTVLGMLPDVPRKVLGDIPEGYKMLYAVSFGHADRSAPANQYRTPRAPVAECVKFYE